MCKIQGFCTLPKDFLGKRPYHCIARARGGLRNLSDRAQRMRTKGLLMSCTTEGALASVFKRSFIGAI